MAVRPKMRGSTIRKLASPANSTSVRRAKRDRSNRMVSCGSQLMRAPAATQSRVRRCAVCCPVARYMRSAAWVVSVNVAPASASAAISNRSPPVMPPAQFNVTAFSAADADRGNKARKDPDWRRSPNADRPPRSLADSFKPPRARGCLLTVGLLASVLMTVSLAADQTAYAPDTQHFGLEIAAARPPLA